jgi:hypothetical protein
MLQFYLIFIEIVTIFQNRQIEYDGILREWDGNLDANLIKISINGYKVHSLETPEISFHI